MQAALPRQVCQYRKKTFVRKAERNGGARWLGSRMSVVIE
jgi:hypothetical protein